MVFLTVHLFAEWPQILGCALGPCRFLLIWKVWATLMAQFPWGWQAPSCSVSPETPSRRACEPWFWERSLQTQTRVRLSGKVIMGPMLRPKGKIVRNCQSGDSKAVAEAFVSGLCVHNGLRMQVWSHGSMGDFSSLRFLWLPRVTGFLGEGKSAVFYILGCPKIGIPEMSSGTDPLENPTKC